MPLGKNCRLSRTGFHWIGNRVTLSCVILLFQGGELLCERHRGYESLGSFFWDPYWQDRQKQPTICWVYRPRVIPVSPAR